MAQIKEVDPARAQAKKVKKNGKSYLHTDKQTAHFEQVLRRSSDTTSSSTTSCLPSDGPIFSYARLFTSSTSTLHTQSIHNPCLRSA
ncbi:hypothetical protein A0H81_09107 [Grifola frondosa]|uniref:Uncharacterized protein n=1 Tax=Grifola frondosa TaxID=5627 RepID=A0A1C7M1X5_GRIFR|nr:hypothetical protein A0H81_09107 [Grifola frondosa]